MPNPFFHFKKFSILHQDKGLRVTTDSCLLGAISGHFFNNKPASIIDIGTGTGVVAMMLAQTYPEAEIKAIEIQEDIAKQAQMNFEASPFSSRLSVVNSDFLDYKPYPCDILVCNPPYYNSYLEGRSRDKNLAMHNITLDHDKLIEHASEFMHHDSHFNIILPTEMMPSRIEMARRSGLNLFYQLKVNNVPGKPYRTVAMFSKNRRGYSEEQLTLQDGKGNKTIEFRVLMNEFYLDDSSEYKRNKNSET